MSKAIVIDPAWVPARGGLPKAEQTRRTRELIIRTGIDCLARFGFANTTMLLISREAGISRGPLHYHFADRNALMAAIADALPQTIPAQIVDRLRAARTLEARIDTIIDIAIDEHLGSHHFAAIELLLAARNDVELSAAIRPHQLRSEAAIDAWWTAYFALFDWPEARLVAFRNVTVACLRGLAIDHLLQGEATAHAEALALFRDMFTTFARHGG